MSTKIEDLPDFAKSSNETSKLGSIYDAIVFVLIALIISYTSNIDNYLISLLEPFVGGAAIPATVIAKAVIGYIVYRYSLTFMY